MVSLWTKMTQRDKMSQCSKALRHKDGKYITDGQNVKIQVKKGWMRCHCDKSSTPVVKMSQGCFVKAMFISWYIVYTTTAKVLAAAAIVHTAAGIVHTATATVWKFSLRKTTN